jgi:hypothetical protein
LGEGVHVDGVPEFIHEGIEKYIPPVWRIFGVDCVIAFFCFVQEYRLGQ